MNNDPSVAELERLVGITSHWSPAFSDRAFYFDAFISHNSEDSIAQALAESLRGSGVRVWCNESGDMRSMRVMERIARALYFSRYVLVCVGQGFRDSPWVKAEYLNALRSEEEAGGTRVLVVCPTETFSPTCMPDALKGIPRHSIVQPADVALLARTLIDGNRLPGDAISKHGQYPDRSADWNWLQQARDAIGSDETQHRCLRALASALDEEPMAQMLMAARCGICDASFSESAKGLDAFGARFLFEAGKWFSLSTDTDERANGLMILGHLDTLGISPGTRTLLIDALAREDNGAVLRELSRWMTAVKDAQLTQHLGALTHAALVEHSLFVGTEPFARFCSELPEAVRIRLAVRSTLDLRLLGLVERAHLCFGRIDFLLGGKSTDDHSESLAVNIELALRVFHALLKETAGAENADDAAQVEEYFVSASEKIADLWEGSRASEMRGVAEWVPDFLAASLIWAGRHPHLGSRVEHAYSRICGAIENAAGRRLLGAALRTVLKRQPYIDKHDVEKAITSALWGIDWLNDRRS